MTAELANDRSSVGNCYTTECPAREVLDHVFTRWGALVLSALLDGPKRYSELRARIGGISEKMLAQTLRTLERDGLLTRVARPVVPPHVTYSLTPLGSGCAERAVALVTWIEAHIGEIETSRASVDGR